MALRSLSSVPAQIKQHHLASLHSSFLNASSRFSSYNFREYFIRRSNQKFQDELPKLIGTKEVNDLALGSVNEKTREKLHLWWQNSLEELDVLERASRMNQLFEGPKLVVEGGAGTSTPQRADTPGIDNIKTGVPEN